MLEDEARRLGIKSPEFRTRRDLIRLIVKNRYGDQLQVGREMLARGVRGAQGARDLLGVALGSALSNMPEPFDALIRLRNQVSLPRRRSRRPGPMQSQPPGFGVSEAEWGRQGEGRWGPQRAQAAVEDGQAGVGAVAEAAADVAEGELAAARAARQTAEASERPAEPEAVAGVAEAAEQGAAVALDSGEQAPEDAVSEARSVVAAVTESQEAAAEPPGDAAEAAVARSAQEADVGSAEPVAAVAESVAEAVAALSEPGATAGGDLGAQAAAAVAVVEVQPSAEAVEAAAVESAVEAVAASSEEAAESVQQAPAASDAAQEPPAEAMEAAAAPAASAADAGAAPAAAQVEASEPSEGTSDPQASDATSEAVPSPAPAVLAASRKFDDEPIPTHSMARLLASQGHRDRALVIYEELLAHNSADEELRREAEALRSGRAVSEAQLPAPSAGTAAVPSTHEDDRIECEALPERGLRLRWSVSGDGRRRARAVLGSDGELAVRLVAICPDAERVVRSEVREHGPVSEQGEWTAQTDAAAERWVASVGLREGERFVSIAHVRPT